MKTETKITKIEHDDLVNLFATATYGSQFFDVVKKKSDYYGTELEDENDSREDTWAKVLLSGKPVYVLDYYSEECAYGKLPHKWSAQNEAMKYTVTLEDIKTGLQKCLDGTFDFNDGCKDAEAEYLRKCMADFVNDDAINLDQPEAEAILQVITFGGLIYG